MESTPGILFTGYPYFLKKFREQDSDIYETRVLFKKAIAMKGEEAAEIFYDLSKFKREGAAPKRLQKTLFGQGGVQGLDDEEHRRRKGLFMSFMNPDSVNRLERHFNRHWLEALDSWKKRRKINLFEESEKILCRAAHDWTGVPLPEDEVELRTSQLSDLIESSGGVGPRHWKGRRSRKKLEEWLKKQVEEIRNGESEVAEDSIFRAFSLHRDTEGNLLKKKVVAVEILNLLRPIVAIARYIVFSALALHEYPEYHKKLSESDGDLYRPFVQEVRRFYPFFPFVAAKVRKSFEWRDVEFPKGRLVLLDLYGTNHDRSIWRNAGDFLPERFLNWNGSPFSFIPQGGGDFEHNHRCAGEWITIQLTRSALVFLIEKMDYRVPKQDLSIDLSRIPAIPKSRFIMKKVRVKS